MCIFTVANISRTNVTGKVNSCRERCKAGEKEKVKYSAQIFENQL